MNDATNKTPCDHCGEPTSEHTADEQRGCDEADEYIAALDSAEADAEWRSNQDDA